MGRASEHEARTDWNTDSKYPSLSNSFTNDSLSGTTRPKLLNETLDAVSRTVIALHKRVFTAENSALRSLVDQLDTVLSVGVELTDLSSTWERVMDWRKGNFDNCANDSSIDLDHWIPCCREILRCIDTQLLRLHEIEWSLYINISSLQEQSLRENKLVFGKIQPLAKQLTKTLLALDRALER